MSGAAGPANSTILPAEQSAAVRDRLVSEIAGLESQDSALAWAREALPFKKALTETDARQEGKPHRPGSVAIAPEPSPQNLAGTSSL